MTVAIMQPYLFPYPGYYQLVRAADHFVLLDDVKWIKGGWINRNRILVDGGAHRFTVGVARGSSHAPIRSRRFARHAQQDVDRLLATLRHAYARAPHFEATRAWAEDVLAEAAASMRAGADVATIVGRTIVRTADHLGLRTTFSHASDVPEAAGRTRTGRLLAILAAHDADAFVNPIGGAHLYDAAPFRAEGVRLHFLRPAFPDYPQHAPAFVPRLSILDALMYLSRDAVRRRLDDYRLVSPQAYVDAL